MSTELKTIENTGRKGVDLQFTSFWGGKEKGLMIQVTQGLGGTIIGREGDPGFILLTIEDAYNTSIELIKWIKNTTHDRAETLKKEIKKHKELENTLIGEAVDCEKFIADLKIIELPVRLLK